MTERDYTEMKKYVEAIRNLQDDDGLVTWGAVTYDMESWIELDMGKFHE